MSHLGPLDDFADNATTTVALDGMSLLVVRRGDDAFVYANSCPHTRESLDPLGGSVAGPQAVLIHCQRHGAEFLSDTGECVAGPCLGERLQSIPFTLSNGAIYLD